MIWNRDKRRATGRADESILCFYRENEEYGCFSNWYRADFEYAGMRFTSVEQFMMYHKVSLFRQRELEERILATDDPAVIKKLGRTKFREFDGELWEKISYAIVKRGVRAKFEQNEDLLRNLLDTGERVMAECSLRDTKWGIGVAIDDPNCCRPGTWKGQNYLGRILMEVRDDLRRAATKGALGYRDARDMEFPEWNAYAGTLLHSPKFHGTVCAYADTLGSDRLKTCFLYEYTLAEWETAMRTNMGGGLTAVGFWELKQDVFDILKA